MGPDEVRVAVSDPQPDRPQAVGERDPRGDGVRDAPLDLVLVGERDRGGRLGGHREKERLADLVDRGAQLAGAAQPVAGAQSRQPVGLGEGAQQHQVGVAAQQVDGGVGVAEGERELAVGLVEDHRAVAGDALQERLDLIQGQGGRGGVVGVADDHQSRGDGELGGHRLQVVAVLGIQRDLHRPGAAVGRQLRVDRERRPGVEHLGAGLQQHLTGAEQDLTRPVAEDDPLGLDPVAIGQRPTQRLIGGVGIAVDARQCGLGGGDRLGVGPER
jgi:hypothetical protein